MQFVIIDMDVPRPAVQQALVKKYYQGDTPDLVIVNKSGRVVLNVIDHRGSPVTPASAMEKVLDAAIK